MRKSCATTSIRIESNSYEYREGPTDRHSMRLHYTSAHSGEVLLLGWQERRRRYSSRIDRQKGMIHEQCHITCHGCEIAIGIVALDVSRRSIPRLRQVFFSSRSLQRETIFRGLFFRNLEQRLSSRDRKDSLRLLSDHCFSSILEIVMISNIHTSSFLDVTKRKK